jgi:hypothetical protein
MKLQPSAAATIALTGYGSIVTLRIDGSGLSPEIGGYSRI